MLVCMVYVCVCELYRWFVVVIAKERQSVYDFTAVFLLSEACNILGRLEMIQNETFAALLLCIISNTPRNVRNLRWLLECDT